MNVLSSVTVSHRLTELRTSNRFINCIVAKEMGLIPYFRQYHYYPYKKSNELLKTVSGDSRCCRTLLTLYLVGDFYIRLTLICETLVRSPETHRNKY